ncbi:4-hydroxy-3-methylbut-2-enyl diphosphate reductase, partial [hydrothermal vent metagenome]
MRKKEEIKVAKTAGFCWGVKRAIDLTLETANSTNGPVYTHGPLIHNPQVIEMLEGKEVYAIKEASDLDNGKVIIRTHGIAPDVRQEIKSRDLSITDATCPLVAKVQGIIKKYANRGYTTIIIGDEGHAEVVGLTGFTQGRCHVVKSIEEIDALPPMDNVCVVAQTTCDTLKYKGLEEAIVAKYPDAVVNNTICDATVERQEEVLELANEVDAMVVVGGKNSSNTRRLASLAEQTGATVFLIETDEEIDLDEMARFERIGLTAGASTPAWMIQRVHERLRKTSSRPAPSFVRTLRSFIEAIVLSNLGVAIGAGFMVLANSILTGIAFSWSASYIAGAYLFSMHVLNRLNDIKTFKHNEPEKIRFYLKHRSLMTAAALIAAGIALGLALSIGISTTLVLVGAVIVGLMYTVKWFPKSKFVRFHRLKDIPASKDIFVGVAWAVVTAI